MSLRGAKDTPPTAVYQKLFVRFKPASQGWIAEPGNPLPVNALAGEVMIYEADEVS
jgi:hypothetical protein